MELIFFTATFFFPICISMFLTSTLSPVDQEIEKIQADLQLVNDPNTALLKWLANERVARKQDYENIGSLKTLVKQDQEVLWQATARAAIDDFESMHGKDKGQKLDKSSLPKNVSYYEQTRQTRELRWKWMFKEKKNEYRVKELIDLIEKSEDFASTDEFAYFISVSYNELSDEIKKKLLTPPCSSLSFNRLTPDKKANAALSLFLSRYDFRGVDVQVKEKKEIDEAS